VVFDALVVAVVLVVLVAVSALLSGTEAALLGFPRPRRREDGAPVDDRVARVDRLLEHPQKIILTVTVATTALNVAAAVLAAGLAFQTFPGAPGAVVGVVVAAGSLVLLTFAQVLPKAVASHHAEGWSLAAAGPFNAIVAITRGGLVPAAIVARELNVLIRIIPGAS